MQYVPIGKFGPAGQNTVVGGETPSATIPATNSPLSPTSGLRYNPSGEYVAYDTNLFETLTWPFRAAGDTAANDPPGNGGNQPDYGKCDPTAPPDPDGFAPLTAVAGRCPNHHLEYLDYFEETMEDILGPFGVTVKRYPFLSPGGTNTKSGQAHNIAAVVPGADHPDETVIVSGHYDQTTEAPASAWDSAEGHAEVIRMAKIMADYWKETGTRPAATIKFAPWDQEESGLLGSADYVANNIPPGEEDKVRGYFNVDPCGGAYPAFYRGNPADRVPLTLQVVNPDDHADDADFQAEINAFNARAETVVDEVFDQLDDQLFTAAGSPPIYVSDAEAAAMGIDSQRDEIQTALGGLLLFTSDYQNFENIGVPFFNLGPAFFGPSANGEPNREDGIAILHTPNDNPRTINALTDLDQTGQTASEGWAKGMELCTQLESWYMLQPEMGGGQTANQNVVAYYEALPNEAVEDLDDVTFDASGSYQYSDPSTGALVDESNLSFSWDFGDGTTGTGKIAQHTYTEVGRFNSTLTVTNTLTSQSDTMSIPITVTPSPLVPPELEPVDEDDAKDGSFELAWEFDGAQDGFDHFSVQESTDLERFLTDDGSDPATNFNVEPPTNAAIDAWQQSDSGTQKNRGNLFHSEPRSFYTGVSRANHQPGVQPNDGTSILTQQDTLDLPTGKRTTLTYFSDFANDANDVGRVEVAIDEGTGDPLDWQVVDHVGLDERDRDVMAIQEEPTELLVPNFELRTVDLTRYAGRSIRLRWVYDLGDALFVNAYRHGWYVDDISVTAGNYQEIGQTPLDDRTFTVSGRTAGVYGYRVLGVYTDDIPTAASNVEAAAVTSSDGAGGGGAGGGSGGAGGTRGEPGPCSNVIRGTKKPDRLTGTDGSDRMSGKNGRDRLRGLAAADCLRGGTGPDRVDGGAGDDEIRAGRGEDRLDCGAGDDTVFADPRVDEVARNCETIRDERPSP